MFHDVCKFLSLMEIIMILFFKISFQVHLPMQPRYECLCKKTRTHHGHACRQFIKSLPLNESTEWTMMKHSRIYKNQFYLFTGCQRAACNTESCNDDQYPASTKMETRQRTAILSCYNQVQRIRSVV